MQFSLATPEDNKKVLSNATKVKIHLSTGIVEILDRHQDLLGRIDINLLEVESNQENKIEKFKYILQEGIIVVATKGLTVEPGSQTGVYIFAKRIIELNSNLSIDELSKKLDQKIGKLDSQKQLLAESVPAEMSKIKAKIILLQEEVEFEKKVIVFAKEAK